MSNQDQLNILVDVRSRLDELVKTQQEFVRLRQEVNSTGNMLRTGFGIDIARRGLDLLTGSVRGYLLESFRMADEIKDGARNLGLTNEAYQVLGNTLKDAGGDVSLLTMAVSNSNRSLVEARQLGSAAAGAYRTLGLDAAKLDAMPTELRFEAIGRAVNNATDRTQAYSAASQILGARNLPTLLGALKDLAEDGWDKVSEAQRRAGRVLTDDTITRLEAAKKELEKLKQAATIFTGENAGGAMTMWDSLKSAFSADKGGLAKAMGNTGLQAMFTPWKLFTGNSALVNFLAGYAPAAPTVPGQTPDGSAAKDIALKEALAQAETNLAKAILHRQTVENDPTRSDYQKRPQSIMLMKQELELRQKLYDATKAAPLEGTETQRDRDLRLQKLEEQNKQLRQQLLQAQYGTDAAAKDQGTRDRYSRFNDEGGLGGGFSMGGSLRLGAMDWITSLGSAAEQVSGVVQSTLGATVKGVGDGIYGWLTGTQSFGGAMLQLSGTVFRTILDTIIQIGVQWLVTQILIKTGMISTHALGETLRVQRMGATAAEGAAAEASMAPAAATSSIASFGAAAAIGIAALIAAMAIFGGFSTGGYTGDGGTSEVAGVVHGQEYVLNAAATARLGTGFLDAINAGAPVSSSAAPRLGADGGGASIGGSTNVNVAVFMDESAAMQWLGTRTGKKILYRKLGQDRGELGMDT